MIQDVCLHNIAYKTIGEIEPWKWSGDSLTALCLVVRSDVIAGTGAPYHRVRPPACEVDDSRYVGKKFKKGFLMGLCVEGGFEG